MNSRLAGRGVSASVALLSLACLAACLVSFEARGQVTIPASQVSDPRGFAVGNTAWGATNAWTIVPEVGGKQAFVLNLEVSTDNAPGRLTIYTNGMRVVSPQPVLGGTNVQLTTGATAGVGTNGFAAGDTVIIRGETGSDVMYQRAMVHAVGTTNISLKQTLTALGANASIWRCGTNQVITAVTNGATSLRAGQFVTVGRRGEPMLIDLIGTAAVFINGAGGEYR